MWLEAAGTPHEGFAMHAPLMGLQCGQPTEMIVIKPGKPYGHIREETRKLDEDVVGVGSVPV